MPWFNCARIKAGVAAHRIERGQICCRAIWRDEAQDVLDMARRELAAAQDENKILHGELTAMEHHLKNYRDTTSRELEEIPKLQVCNST